MNRILSYTFNCFAMQEYMSHLPLILISLLLTYFIFEIVRISRKRHLKTKQDHLDKAKRQLLDFYQLASKIYEIPDLDFRFFSEGEKDIESAIKIQVVQLTLLRQSMVFKVNTLVFDIRNNMEASGYRSFFESFLIIENIHGRVQKAYGDFLKYIQSDYDKDRMIEMYNSLPKSFSDDNHLITAKMNKEFFDLQSKLTDAYLKIELKLIKSKKSLIEGFV